ncbi:hypothetical protein SAMN05444407_109156 [Chryseobacterium contaminans]|uniref:Lipocalin-like domain-containing protein n=2 Tax=Chryseobacterium contaminans TaxID=1423959 RepID=A0A1M7G428_9FLAO|nr:hypothetical protein [Chryseobacterium contaminans]SHM10589.1 hypothetical protein SAMN05444407_109156 [Chryseobacterium contaminans]
MKNIRLKLTYLFLLFFTAISCQTKEEKKIDIAKITDTPTVNLYFGKWFLINQENDKYYYCTDSDRFFEIDNTEIVDHTPMEDSGFNVDHITNKGDLTYIYTDKKESSYYILKWIDRNKGIISCQFKKYEPSLFINEKKIKAIENKTCQTKNKSCELNNLSSKYNFIIEAGEFSNEKDQKHPISAWIIIIDKKSGKKQEIHFEPNLWAEYSDLPCDSFLVKDFNFDGLEDFAIVWDQGGNAGKLYEYYFQNKEGNFSSTDSFPLQHKILAEDIDALNKTIKTQSIVGCCHFNLNTYKLKSDGSWEASSEQRELNKK